MKWNDFTSNASRAFSSLRHEEYLHNVTLVSNDNQQVSAHKLVLSACSEYFRNIFKNNPSKHPLLCIDGVTKEDLTNIMDYMYKGEVHVYQDNLDRFITIAQRFKLQGLLGGSLSSDEVTEDYKVVDRPDSKEDIPYLSDLRKMSTPNPNGNEITAQEGWRQYKVASRSQSSSQEKVIYPISAENIDDIEEKVSEYLEKVDTGNFRCKICGKEGNRSRNLKNHIETHMEGLSFPCGNCGKIFRSRIQKQNHELRLHKA